ncbi:MAG TPA: sugar transferase, partial [Acidimicrobiales bacterium]|nr:sugar transferase [Acidimicrobiales bacterium]
MRRLARPLMLVGTVLVVLGLSKAHAAAHAYDYTASSRLVWSVAYMGLLVVAGYGAGLPDLARTRRSALLGALGSTLVATLGLSVLQLVFGAPLLPRFVVLGTAALLVPFLVVLSTLARDGATRDGQRDRVVAVARLDEGIHLGDELDGHPERPAVLARVLSPEEATGQPGRLPLVEAVRSSRATAVVLDRAAQNDDSIVAQAAELHEAGVRVRTLSLFYDQWLGKLPLSELERVSLLFDIGELHRARYGRIKRMLDTVSAAAGFVVLVAVTPAVWLGNRLANRGPLLYRQTRVGKGGREFEILKFRTMTPAAGVRTEWTTEDDPRITPFGSWLRRSHLDELPQVVNILRGDLSLVGPRPEQPQYVEELEAKIPFYRLRHLVRPGLTGWAQVKYPYGATEGDAMEKLQYEFYYLRHQGLGLDLRITGRTLRSV